MYNCTWRLHTCVCLLATPGMAIDDTYMPIDGIRSFVTKTQTPMPPTRMALACKDGLPPSPPTSLNSVPVAL